MKIVFANCFYWPDLAGGAERSVKRLADLHVKAGHEVSVLTTHQGSNIKEDCVDGVKVFRLPPHNLYWARQADQPVGWKRMLWHGLDSFNIQSYFAIRKLLTHIQPDIVSSQNLPGLSVSTWSAAKSLDIPVVQVLRDYYTLCPRSTMYKDGQNCATPCGACRAFRLPHRRLSNQLDAVVGCSKAVLDRHLDLGLYLQTPIKKVIYNAENILVNAPRRLRRPEDTFTFGYIGALTEVKGIHDMLRAFLQARKLALIPLRMVLAGTGPDSFVKRLKDDFADSSIEFLGQAEPKALFSQSDATIVASVWNDPLPATAFQALAHGVPVIGARRGGIPEMVTHDHNGLLYAPERANELQSVMLRMVNEPGLHARLASNAQASATHFLSEDRLFSEYMSVYTQIMDRRFQILPTTP